MSRTIPPQGKGLGLRRALLRPLEDAPHAGIDFFEAAPENWIDIGGALGRRFRALSERHPLVCHGLSLNLGGPAPLDLDFVGRIKEFLASHGACCYSEHLSYCADDGYFRHELGQRRQVEIAFEHGWQHAEQRIGLAQQLPHRRRDIGAMGIDDQVGRLVLMAGDVHVGDA